MRAVPRLENGIFCAWGKPPQGNHGITDKFVNKSFMVVDQGDHRIEVQTQLVRDLRRGHTCSLLRKRTDICKKNDAIDIAWFTIGEPSSKKALGNLRREMSSELTKE